MNISLKYDANGITLYFWAKDVTPPPTVKVQIDNGRETFEGCPTQKDGEHIAVHISRNDALIIEAGEEVQVETLGLKGTVEWPVLPVGSNNSTNRIGATVADTSSRPAALQGLQLESGAFPISGQATPEAPPQAPQLQDPTPTPAPELPVITEAPPAAPLPQPEPAPAPAPSVVATEPAPEAPAGYPPQLSNAKPKLITILSIIGGGILFILAVLCLVWYFFFKNVHIPFLSDLLTGHTAEQHMPHEGRLPPPPTDNTTPPHQITQDTTPPPSQPVPATTADGGMNLTDMSVPDVVQKASSAQAIGVEGQRRLTSGKPDDGLRLLEAAADKGDTNSMDNLAHLYDPSSFKQGGPVPQADEQEAARYYQQAAKAGDTSIKEDRAKLRAKLQQRADDGDYDAPLTLKNYFEGSTQP